MLVAAQQRSRDSGAKQFGGNKQKKWDFLSFISLFAALQGIQESQLVLLRI
jgi:hypothetical protein